MKHLIILFLMSSGVCAIAQQGNINRISFPSVASTDNSLRVIIGSPYGSYLSDAGAGSLTVADQYSETLAEVVVDSTTTSINNIVATEHLFKVYPNPTSDRLLIETAGVFTNETLTLFDGGGRLVSRLKTTDSSKKHEMNLVGLSKGVYTLAIQNSKTGFIQTNQIIIK